MAAPGAADAGSNTDGAAATDASIDAVPAIDGGGTSGAGGAGGAGGVGGGAAGTVGSGGSSAGSGGSLGTGGSGGDKQVVDAARETRNNGADEVSGCAVSPPGRASRFPRVAFISILGWALLLKRRRPKSSAKN